MWTTAAIPLSLYACIHQQAVVGRIGRRPHLRRIYVNREYTRTLHGILAAHASATTGCALAQHCYNGDVSFLWEKMEKLTPCNIETLE